MNKFFIIDMADDFPIQHPRISSPSVLLAVK